MNSPGSSKDGSFDHLIEDWVSKAGFVFLALTVFLVPVFVLPLSLVPGFDTDRAEMLLFKIILQEVLALFILICGSILFLGHGMRKYPPCIVLPCLTLIAYLGWSFVSVLLSPNSWYSTVFWLPQAMMVLAALCAPMFLTNTNRIRWVIFALLLGGLTASLIAVVSAMGWKGFYLWSFGYDPRDRIGQSWLFEGSGTRAVSSGTLLNPEYAGGFAAIQSAIAAVLLYDWAPKSKYTKMARIAALSLLGLFLLHLFFSGSRQPWIALFLAGLLRFSLAIGIRSVYLAFGFCLSLAVAFFHSIVLGALFFLFYFLGLFVYMLIKGGLGRFLVRADRANTLITIAGAFIIGVVFIAFSVPGPWNPNGMRLAQRFTEVTSSSDRSVQERLLMYIAASEMIGDNPFFGIGPGRYANQMSFALMQSSERDESGIMSIARQDIVHKVSDNTHNDYLQTAAEMGIPALILFLTSMLLILYGLAAACKSDHLEIQLCAYLLLCGIVATLGLMITSFPLQTPSRATLFWTMVGASLSLIACNYSYPKTEKTLTEST